MPRSRLCRVVSNVELLERNDGEFRVGANALIFESNARGETVWSARNEYLLRRDGQSQLVYKHAISTLQPLHPVNLAEVDGDEADAD